MEDYNKINFMKCGYSTIGIRDDELYKIWDSDFFDSFSIIFVITLFSKLNSDFYENTVWKPHRVFSFFIHTLRRSFKGKHLPFKDN